MIFLIDHQAECLLRIDEHAPRAVRFRQLATNQLTLDKQLPVERRQLGDFNLPQALPAIDASDGIFECFFDGLSIAVSTAANERKRCEIPRQSNATGDDDFALRPGAAEPFAAAIGQLLELVVGHRCGARPLLDQRPAANGAPARESYRESAPPARNAPCAWLLPSRGAIELAHSARRCRPRARAAACRRAASRHEYLRSAASTPSQKTHNRAGSRGGLDCGIHRT